MRLVGTLNWRASSAALIGIASSSSARCSPECIAIIDISILLMIVHYFHVDWPRRFIRPFEACTPLVVNADAVLAFAGSLQSFKAVAGKGEQILHRNGRLKSVELQSRSAFDS